MPAKYHIHSHPAPPRVQRIGKLGIVDWREDCSSCHNCVKRSCIYGLYREEYDRLINENGYLDYLYQCKGCLSCVQNCTKNILTRVINPEFSRIGDDYNTADIILSNWYQAETGSIPVSGSGYGGPFSGYGFDSMWTDMSEIVRPTRDGIHGREYINTSVDIGRKLPNLAFENGKLAVAPPPLLETPFPVVFDVIPECFNRGPVIPALVKAAKEISLYSMLRAKEIKEHGLEKESHVVPLLETDEEIADNAYEKAKMLAIADSKGISKLLTTLKKKAQDRIVIIRVPTTPKVAQRVQYLASKGAEVIQLIFNSHGQEKAKSNPRHMRDVIRDVHGALIKDGIRDEITLMSSGGIVMAEHITKALLCGLDLVAIDLPLMVAMECRQCGECARGEICPVALEEIDLDFAAQRTVNLMGAWHSQLLEMMGAMGIREARRLRGEVGRCMFFEDLERNTFGKIFGKRKAEKGASRS